MRRRLALLLLLSVSALGPADDFALKDRDRVVFYGDSITDNAPYGTFIEGFVSCRYPNLDLSFMNAGVGGDRVTGGWMGKIDDRLTRDLFSRNPTVVTIMLGMNDASYRPFDQGIFDTYQSGYKHMVDRMKAESPTARAWLIRPSPFDDVTRAPSFEGGYNAVLVKYGDFVQQLATSNGYNTIDMNAPLVAMLGKANAQDPANAQKLIPDRVHPGGGTHLLMADEILKSWHANPLVSNVRIDWASGQATADGATLSHYSNGAFDLSEKSLPFPIERSNADYALVEKSSSLLSDLNQEMLIVTGLPSGNYDLKIDGKVIGTIPAEAYAAGIDLSSAPTPMLMQAGHVMDLTGRIVALRYARWRMLEHGLDGVSSTKARDDAIASFEKLEKALMAERRKAAQPVSHHFEIARHA